MPDDRPERRENDRVLGELCANVQRVLDGQTELKETLIRHENGPHQKVEELLAIHDKRLNAHAKQLGFIEGGTAAVLAVWGAIKGWVQWGPR